MLQARSDSAQIDQSQEGQRENYADPQANRRPERQGVRARTADR
jgi:hypothetical protein